MYISRYQFLLKVGAFMQLHPWLMAIFMAVFTVMSLVGFINQVKSKRKFPAVLLALAFIIFGFSVYFSLQV